MSQNLDATGDGDQTQTPQGLEGLILSESDLAELDAKYQPFPPLSAWSQVKTDTMEVDALRGVLERRRGEIGEAALQAAVGVALRAAALETGAIEGLYETNRGLTITVALQAANWETAMRAESDKMADLFRAQLRAYDVASEIAAREQPITEKWIRELHEILCAPQATYHALTPQGWAELRLAKGEYKTLPNHVRLSDGGAHAYAPVLETPAEMHRLVEELNSTTFDEANPILQAAFAHHAFVSVHPFADGNGRVARALASVFLRRRLIVPLLIWSDQRRAYFAALEEADKNNQEPFAAFVLERVSDAFELVGNSLGPKAIDFTSSLSALHTSAAGLPYPEVDAIASQIAQYAADIIGQYVRSLTLSSGIVVAVNAGGNAVPLPDPSYRHPVGVNSSFIVSFRSQPPAEAAISYSFQVLVKKDTAATNLYRVEVMNPNMLPINIRLSEWNQSPAAPSIEARIQAWAERLVAYGLEYIAGKGKEQLRNAGYA